MSRLFSTLTMGMVALLSVQTAFALSILAEPTPAQAAREKYNLYITSEKKAYERISKLNIYDKDKGINVDKCRMTQGVFLCNLTKQFFFEFADDILGSITYDFTSNDNKHSNQITPQQKQEILTILQLAIDDEAMAKKVYEDLISQYNAKLAKHETSNYSLIVATTWYPGLIFELQGSEDEGLRMLTID